MQNLENLSKGSQAPDEDYLSLSRDFEKLKTPSKETPSVFTKLREGMRNYYRGVETQKTFNTNRLTFLSKQLENANEHGKADINKLNIYEQTKENLQLKKPFQTQNVVSKQLENTNELGLVKINPEFDIFFVESKDSENSPKFTQEQNLCSNLNAVNEEEISVEESSEQNNNTGKNYKNYDIQFKQNVLKTVYDKNLAWASYFHQVPLGTVKSWNCQMRLHGTLEDKRVNNRRPYDQEFDEKRNGLRK